MKQLQPQKNKSQTNKRQQVKYIIKIFIEKKQKEADDNKAAAAAKTAAAAKPAGGAKPAAGGAKPAAKAPPKK